MNVVHLSIPRDEFMQLRITDISFQQTKSVRKTMGLVDDEQPSPVDLDLFGHHFGALHNGDVVAVCSVFMLKYHGRNVAKIRKLAVLTDYQGHGLGKAMVRHVIEYLQHYDIQYVWSDVTTSAIPFYKKAGLRQKSSVFSYQNVDYVKMSLIL